MTSETLAEPAKREKGSVGRGRVKEREGGREGSEIRSTCWARQREGEGGGETERQRDRDRERVKASQTCAHDDVKWRGTIAQ